MFNTQTSGLFTILIVFDAWSANPCWCLFFFLPFNMSLCFAAMIKGAFKGLRSWWLVLAKPRLTYHIAVVYPILFHKGDGHAIQQNINQKICLALLFFFFLFVFIHNLYNQTGINFYVGGKVLLFKGFFYIYFNFSFFLIYQFSSFHLQYHRRNAAICTLSTSWFWHLSLILSSFLSLSPLIPSFPSNCTFLFYFAIELANSVRSSLATSSPKLRWEFFAPQGKLPPLVAITFPPLSAGAQGFPAVSPRARPQTHLLFIPSFPTFLWTNSDVFCVLNVFWSFSFLVLLAHQCLVVVKDVLIMFTEALNEKKCPLTIY